MTITEISDIETPADTIAKCIQSYIDNEQPVLWLVSGGSALKLVPVVTDQLQNPDKSIVHIGLVDERFGEPDHPDSNWKKLADTGTDLSPFQLHPVLQAKSFQETTEDYAKDIASVIASGAHVVALLGIGSDGHTAGMLPTSEEDGAMFHEALVAGYHGEDFDRITMSHAALASFNEVFVYAEGEDKYAQIKRLDEDIPLHEQPAQILKQCANVTVFYSKEKL